MPDLCPHLTQRVIGWTTLAKVQRSNHPPDVLARSIRRTASQARMAENLKDGRATPSMEFRCPCDATRQPFTNRTAYSTAPRLVPQAQAPDRVTQYRKIRGLITG